VANDNNADRNETFNSLIEVVFVYGSKGDIGIEGKSGDQGSQVGNMFKPDVAK
jgi:hypothetical protein